MMARQGGMALVISLIFLAVVSLLAMASMQSALLQEKMAGNQKESQQALQAAEAALRAAERYLEAGSSGPTTTVPASMSSSAWRWIPPLPPRPGAPMPIAA
ncbi:pilus assembly PilX family protein [Aeromonas hydrophila]